MKYIIAAQLYWPVWLLLLQSGHGTIGIIAGVIVAAVVWLIMWRLDFGTWVLGTFRE